MLKNKMPSIDETAPLVDRFFSGDPFPIAAPTSQQMLRYKTFYEENKHSFDDGMSRNIDRDSGFNLARYKRNQKIFKIIVGVVIVVAVVVFICVL
jgi:hypothetical protein